MGIKLDISVETPYPTTTATSLAGISVMLLAIANRQNLAEQDIDLPRDDDLEQPYWGHVVPDASGSCVRSVGHAGRHKFRPVNGIVN